MKYQILQERLKEIEKLIDSSAPAGTEVWTKMIRPGSSSVQGFGLSRMTAENKKDLPVVVAVGINYTQGNIKYPRRDGTVDVEDCLKNCRAKLAKAFEAYRKDKTAWVKFGCASSPTLDVPHCEEFHLVMTNFCLWITNDCWRNIKPADQKHLLLANNPKFDAKSTGSPDWPHLQHLASVLSEDRNLWVAHGIHSGVFNLFKEISATRVGWPLAWGP